MNINQNNYEAYFLDHLEGTLSYEQEKELQEFLKKNPELKLELDEFSEVTVAPDLDVVFKDKASLKKAAPVISFNRKLFYYAAAAAVAILMIFVGINQFKTDFTQPVQVGNGFAAFDIAKGINKIVEENKGKISKDPQNVSATDASAVASNNNEAMKEEQQQKQNIKPEVKRETQVNNIASNSTQPQAPAVQEQRAAESIAKLQPKKAVAIETAETNETELKWRNTPQIEPEKLWAENNVKSKSSTFRELINSGADLGLLPSSFASNTEGSKKSLPNVTIEVPASSNKILDLLFKN